MLKLTISICLCLYGITHVGHLVGQQNDAELQRKRPAKNVAKLAEIQEKLDAGLQQLFDRSEMPGCAFSIVLPYGDVVTATAGMADVENKTPMKAADRMMSASIGKTYFAAIAAVLLRDGKLSLDEKVSTYLGEETWFDRIPNSKDITIAHLMRHQSGVPRYVFSRKLWADIKENPDLKWSPGDQLKYIYDSDPVHPAGEGWAYSDTNYILLGLVLEKVSGKSAYDLVKEKVLVPNKLIDTVPNNQRKLPGLIQGYSTLFQPFGVPPKVVEDGQFVFNPQMEWCGGGFLCTSADLARWAHIYFSGNAFDGDYLSALTKEAADCQGMLGVGSKYGLGVIIRDTRLGTSLGHDGGFPGYSSTMAYFPDRKIAAAFMHNTDTRGAIAERPHKTMVDLVASIVDEE